MLKFMIKILVQYDLSDFFFLIFQIKSMHFSFVKEEEKVLIWLDPSVQN